MVKRIFTNRRPNEPSPTSILPMSKEDEKFWAEQRRRREARRKEQDNGS